MGSLPTQVGFHIDLLAIPGEEVFLCLKYRGQAISLQFSSELMAESRLLQTDSSLLL